MQGPTARVLCLPAASDVREEAERIGVPPSTLEGLAGATGLGQAVRLEGVPHDLAAALPGMIPPHCGLALVWKPAASETSELEATPGAHGHEAAVDRSHSQARESHELITHDFSALLAAPEPLLLEIADRLSSGPDEAERAVAGALRRALEHCRGGNLGTTRCGNLALEWGKRTYVMGILNVTPDSFSGDGIGKNLEAALEQGRRFVEEGADLLDVGGESTRPGSEPVSLHEEIDRVAPVIQRLAAELPVPISIDSYKLPVVREALDAGATMINDVWGLRRSEGLAELAARRDVPIILMHNRRAAATRGHLGGHFRQVSYTDLMAEIVQGLRESVALALRDGIRRENVIVDPGIGFGKSPQQNLVVMRRLGELRSLGRPILMGTSRKSVVGLTLGVSMGERVEGTAATVAVSICNGADVVRVHDVKEMVRVSRMTDAIVRGAQGN